MVYSNECPMGWQLVQPAVKRPLRDCTSDCNQGHARFGTEEELTKFIKENSLCDCKDCSTKEEDTKEEELTNLSKENTLYDCKECNTKEEDTKEVELHNEDDDGVISPGTSYRNSNQISEISMGNTEEDSNTGQSSQEDGHSIILSETRHPHIRRI